jgi:hypothetical protein
MEWEYCRNQGEGYWFTLNPIYRLKSIKSEVSNTFVNTRGINFRGGLGNKSIFRPQFWKSRSICGILQHMPNQLNQREAIQLFWNWTKDFKILHMISFGRSQFNFYQANSSIYSWVTVEILSEMGIDLARKMVRPYPYFKLNLILENKIHKHLHVAQRCSSWSYARTHLCTKFMANHYLSWNISNKILVCLNQLFDQFKRSRFDVNFVNHYILSRCWICFEVVMLF